MTEYPIETNELSDPDAFAATIEPAIDNASAGLELAANSLAAHLELESTVTSIRCPR